MNDDVLRERLTWLLRGGGAHAKFDDAVADLPAELRGRRAPNIPHTPWRLVEHMRIDQWDILEFCRNPDHVSPDFPDGYWPDGDAPPDPGAWDTTIRAFRDDLAAMIALIQDPANDLFTPLPGGNPRQTLLAEALLVADHNAYHVGQLVVVRRALGAWKQG